MISIEKLGVAVSDFIGKHGLMWSDALVAAWEEAEADYTDEMTRAMADEREACAKVCDDDFGNGALNLAAAIRARGQA